jgi:predicted RNA-binding Zn ribbon-like protein
MSFVTSQIEFHWLQKKTAMTMDLMARPAAATKLVGGRLCLDFVNSIGGRRNDPARRKKEPHAVIILRDKLNDYFDLLAWSRRAGLLTEAELQALIREGKRREAEAASVLARAFALREAIYRICKAIVDKRSPQAVDMDLLNQELAQARGHESLIAVTDGFDWQWTGGSNELDRMLWPVARSAAEMLTMGDLTRLHACEGEDCGWLFEDTSRNRSRQWCTMEDCGNLAKVRRFRTRSRRTDKQRKSS